MSNINLLNTEKRNAKTVGINDLSTTQMLHKINDEDKTVAIAVEKEIPSIALAVDEISKRIARGGRLVYVGAGTSGRLGIIDASECRPTFGVDDSVISGLIAGGVNAVFKAQENAEDFEEYGKKSLVEFNLNENDCVFAIAASGRTPFCIGALKYANEIGALSVSLSCNKNTEMSRFAKIAIEVDTGEEVIMGSTRMKAGTAQKLVLNMVSTSVMVKCGRTFDNLMIYVAPTNGKLANRTIRLFCEAINNFDVAYATKALEAANGSLPCAVIMEKTKCSYDVAIKALSKTKNFCEALELCSQA